MKNGFYVIMAAQFFSSLADNALLIAAIAMLAQLSSPPWATPLLKFFFTISYVLLAFLVGAFADSMPKGRVMFVTNAIKVVGCLLILFNQFMSLGHLSAYWLVLLAYAVVGLGAAAYSPAKYGILTELLPPSQLVKANGWIEGLTIASIILGILLGGQLVGHVLAARLLSVDIPFFNTGIDTPPEAAISVLIFVYAVAAWFNTRIPLTGVEMRPIPSNPLELVPDFWSCNGRLWHDRLGQISLATTTLFWGVSGNLRYIILAWSAAALGYSTTQASSLSGVVALGTAVGAVAASMLVRLDRATSVMPLGIAMGILVIAMNFITNAWVAAPFLILLGALGGYLVVPMNALLQHRGHNLMGAGRSIAVQNFNEQACILGLGAFYSLSAGLGMSAFGAITAFGLVVAGVMWLIQRWHASNCVRHKDEVEHLLELARHDNVHG